MLSISKERSRRELDGGWVMSQYDTPSAGREAPFPKYLLKSDARAIIAEIEAEGYLVELTSPGPSAVCVRLTAPDGHVREQIGRADELESALRNLAAASGLDV
jgi:hypothetical protein